MAGYPTNMMCLWRVMLISELVARLMVIISFISVVSCSESNDPKIKRKEPLDNIGFKLPNDVEVLNEREGRRTGEDYYVWILFSKSPFKMPDSRGAQIGGYIDVPSKTNYEILKLELKNQKIERPTKSYFSEWLVGKYTFHGSVTETLSGNYLQLERRGEGSF